MFTQPSELPNSSIAAVIRSAWEMSVDSIEYAPIGFGSHHWRVGNGTRSWFVTVDSVDTQEQADGLHSALTTARRLHDLGLAFVVAPVATPGGELLVPIGDSYLAAIYPHIGGEAFAWGPFPSPTSRLQMLDRLVTLHAAPLEAGSGLHQDHFGLPARHRLDAALADTSSRWNEGPFGETARELLVFHQDRVVEWLANYDRSVSQVAGGSDHFVITHGEPHPGNTISTGDGLMLVDWDTARLAAPERDLWWLTSEDDTLIVEYERRTQRSVDAAALALYRLRWDLTDVALFTAQFRDPHSDNADTRMARDSLAKILGRAP